MKSVEKSKADVIIVGGDLNAEPQDESIKIIESYQMKDSKEDVLNATDLTNDKYATYGNPKNKYTCNEEPVILDWVFYRTNPKADMTSKAVNFRVPTIGLSDHSPIWTTIGAVKHSNKYP